MYLQHSYFSEILRYIYWWVTMDRAGGWSGGRTPPWTAARCWSETSWSSCSTLAKPILILGSLGLYTDLWWSGCWTRRWPAWGRASPSRTPGPPAPAAPARWRRSPGQVVRSKNIALLNNSYQVAALLGCTSKLYKCRVCQKRQKRTIIFKTFPTSAISLRGVSWPVKEKVYLILFSPYLWSKFFGIGSMNLRFAWALFRTTFVIPTILKGVKVVSCDRIIDERAMCYKKSLHTNHQLLLSIMLNWSYELETLKINCKNFNWVDSCHLTPRHRELISVRFLSQIMCESMSEYYFETLIIKY